MRPDIEAIERRITDSQRVAAIYGSYYADDCGALLAYIREIEADKARLDWLEEKKLGLDVDSARDPNLKRWCVEDFWHFKLWRKSACEAIDAAMKMEAKQNV